VTGVCPGAHGHGERQHTEDEGQRGHDDGAQAHLAGQHRGLDDRLALLAQLHREGHPQQRVLRPEADQDEKPDLEVDVVLESPDEVEQQGSEDPEGHGRHDRPGQGPGLVLGGQDEEHEDEAEHEGDGRCAARLLLLVGKPRPGEGVTRRQHLLRHLFHGRDRLPRAVAGGRVAVHLGGGKPVEVRQQVGPRHPLGADHGGQGHHLALPRPGVEPREVFGFLPVSRVGLKDHPPDAARFVVLAHGHGAELGLDRAVDVLHRNAEQGGLVAIDVCPQLLARGPEGGAQPAQFPPLAGPGEELPRDGLQGRRLAAPGVLDPELEAARCADARDRRGSDGDDEPLLDLPALPVQIPEHGPRVLLPGLPHRVVALVEGFQRHEEGSGVRLEPAVQQAVARDLRPVLHARDLREDGIHPAGHIGGPVEARRIGHEDGAQHVPLVLVRDEARGEHHEEVHDGVDHDGQENEGDGHPPDHEQHRPAEGVGEPGEPAVERREEPPLGRPGVFQQGAAHGRREGKGHEPREGHGDGDRDGELPVELPRRPGQECGRDEHGAHDEHRGDNGARHLPHRADGGLPGRQVEFGHVALHVLDDHDGIVDDDADGQYEAEERQQVDRKSQRDHPGEGSDQGDEDRDGADDGCPEILQEEEDHEHDEQDRLEERVLHLLDRDPDEVGRVQGDRVVDSLGEPVLHLLHRIPDRRGDPQAVRAGLLVNGDECGRLTVEPAVDDVLAQPDFRPRHVFQADNGTAVLAGTKNDVLVLRRVLERALGNHGERELHRSRRRFLTDLPRPEELILGGHRLLDVARRNPEGGHPVGVHPDPHGLVGHAHDLRLSRARNPLDPVEDVDIGVVGDVVGPVAVVLAVHGDQHHDGR